MPGTYETINYSLRPAKAIERKMLAEALRKLTPFGPLTSYRYVGFGSPYFSDFILFHKALGLSDMISIEHDEDKSDRFTFNRPYRCIELRFGESGQVLPELEWKKKTILWLDYDGKLSADMLRDIAYFCVNAASGSVLIVTVNAQPDSGYASARNYARRQEEKRLKLLSDRVGKTKIPPGTSGRHLVEWQFAVICHRIMLNEIEEALTAANAGRAAEKKMAFQQLFNFHYADNAKMLTTGGILYEQSQAAQLDECAFERDLSFIRTGNTEFLIEVPKLTYRELRRLDQQLPIADDAKLATQLAIPQTQLDSYRRLYRYFPTFAEAEL